MKIDPGKAWPHPVLRPPDHGDDYPHAEFQADIDPKRVQGGIAIELDAFFDLSDPDLLRLVSEGAARYVLVIKSPKTHFRKSFDSIEPHIIASFSGELSGRVEFSSFLICVEERLQFYASGWHSDFEGLTFDIMPGVVLAEDKPKEYWIDTADEAPIGAIFEHIDNGEQEGRWTCNLESDRVQIQLSKTDSERFCIARDSANQTVEGQYLMNGLYLPVLIEVLNRADKNPDDYGEFRWFTSLNNRLEIVECEQIGSASIDRSIDAQKVLDSPFVKMPLIANAEAG